MDRVRNRPGATVLDENALGGQRSGQILVMRSYVRPLAAVCTLNQAWTLVLHGNGRDVDNSGPAGPP